MAGGGNIGGGDTDGVTAGGGGCGTAGGAGDTVVVAAPLAAFDWRPAVPAAVVFSCPEPGDDACCGDGGEARGTSI